MARINWQKTLNWSDEQIEEIRLAAYTYIRQGKYEIALPFFQALYVMNTKNAYDAQTLGALYLETGQPKKALKCFDRALKLDPDHKPTMINLAKAFLMLGKKEEGLKIAKILKNDADPHISNTAEALILAYS